MPFYEYQCKSCGHDLEAMQKISDRPLKKCPNCGKSQLQRLMSAPVFRLKGGGWYETDFKGDQDNKRNLADRPEADASKEAADTAKDKATDAAKEAAASGADGKGKAAESAGAKDAPQPKDASQPKDKAADKPAEKAPTGSTKPMAGKRSARIHTPGRGKSAGKRPVKRPVHKAKRRI
ncbi:MAG TPA: zinc ribbon domain-containing protein [Steroidobacteraceae bacterium]|jgi:putative FmdB family regulatory protein|nr:zinc ribbon domain-containing protein [Steroidobacteraceae bacterium]